MAKENQVMKEPQQVTTKNPKKVEEGKRLAVHNCGRRVEKKREEQAQSEKSKVNQYYSLGAVLAVGMIGGLCYQSKKGEATTRWGASTSGEQPSNPQQNNPTPCPPQSGAQGPQTNKSEMD